MKYRNENSKPEVALTDCEQHRRIDVFLAALSEMPKTMQGWFTDARLTLVFHFSKDIHSVEVCEDYANAVLAEMFFRKYLQAVCVERFEAA